jgi:uncharacterized protein (DUF362 family)
VFFANFVVNFSNEASMKSTVSIVRYEKPYESVRQVVELAGGLAPIKPGSRVVVKPNIVFWTTKTVLPMWGVITTSRVVEDMVRLLKDHGVSDITIAEGSVVADPKDRETQFQAYKSLGYQALEKRYGVKCVNILARPFTKVDLGDGLKLNFSRDVLESDAVVDLPVLKTHAQTVVSLGIKNLKGTISIPSRKRCHNADPARDLHLWVSRLADPMPPVFTLIDGIFSNERGPAFDGRMRRSDILIASQDIFAADKVGSRVLGYAPREVPHLRHYAERHDRALDLSDVRLTGENLEDVAAHHQYDFGYTDDGTLPRAMAKMGIRGLSYYKYDLSMCTYCSGLTGAVLTAIAMAWKGRPWDDVEVLTGKQMTPRPGKNKTILLGQCMCKRHKNNPDIKEVIPVDGCPPNPTDLVAALHRAGIEVDPGLLENHEVLPGFLMARFKDKPEFDEAYFKIR